MLLYRIAKLVSRSGDGYLQLLLPLLILIYLGQPALPFFTAVLVAFALERSWYWILKNSLKRRRPPVAIPSFEAVIKASDEFSFPSGHTSGAFLLAIMVSADFPLFAMPLFIWAATVGLSRVILGVHFPADILAGIGLAGSVAWVCQSII